MVRVCQQKPGERDRDGTGNTYNTRINLATPRCKQWPRLSNGLVPTWRLSTSSASIQTALQPNFFRKITSPFPKTAPIRSSICTDILRRPTLAPPRGLTWTTTDRLEAPMTLSASAFFPANTEWSYTHVIPSFMRGYATSSCFCGRTCRTPCCRNIRTA